VGAFRSPAEAALALARRFPDLAAKEAERAATSAAAEAPIARMTFETAKDIAEAEGLTLLTDGSLPCGYKGVYKRKKHSKKPFQADVPGGKHTRYIGTFASPHEAALAIARVLGPADSAAIAGEHRNRAGWLMTEESELSHSDALRIAQEQGLTLLRTKGERDKFWGVFHQSYYSTSTVARWRAEIKVAKDFAARRLAGVGGAGGGDDGGGDDGGGDASGGGIERRDERATTVSTSPASSCFGVSHSSHSSGVDERTGRSLGGLRGDGWYYLGSFASAAGAALAIARRLKEDPVMAAHVQSLQQQQMARLEKRAPARGQTRKRGRPEMGHFLPAPESRRPPSWLMPADRAAWFNEHGDDEGEAAEHPAGGEVDEVSDEHDEHKQGEDEPWDELELEPVEVEVWSDHSHDDDEATWVEAAAVQYTV
jgi:hypothetical protein